MYRLRLRKYLPLLMGLFAFCSFLSLQIGYELINGKPSVAKESQEQSEREKILQALLKENNISTEKPILINFWASWCPPCLKEFPLLVQFHQKYRDQVLVLGINNDSGQDHEKLATQIERKFKLPFQSIRDPKLHWMDQLGLESLPSSLIFYQNRIHWIQEKESNFLDQELLKLVDELLKKL